MNFSAITALIVVAGSFASVGCSAETAADSDALEAAAQSELKPSVSLPGELSIDCVPNVASKEKLHVDVSPGLGKFSFKRSGKQPSAGFLTTKTTPITLSKSVGAPNTRTFGMAYLDIIAEGGFTDLTTHKTVGQKTVELHLISSIGEAPNYHLGYFVGFDSEFDFVQKEVLVTCTIK
jgi:hypothetical protein